MAEKIIDDKDYSLAEIISAKLTSIKSYQTLLKRVLEDQAKVKKERTLNANIVGYGRGKRCIWVRGSNLKKFIKN